MVVGLLLAYTGFKLVHSSSTALLDTGDPELLDQLVEPSAPSVQGDINGIHERTLPLRPLHPRGHPG